MDKVYVTREHAEKFCRGWLNKYETHKRLMLNREPTIEELKANYFLTHQLVTMGQIQEEIAQSHG